MTAVESRPFGCASAPHITVVGDAGLDITALLTGPLAHGHDTRARISTAPGGSGANTAAWLAHSRVPVTLISRVGDDDAGRSLRTVLGNDGVDCAFAVDPALPTCQVIVLVGPDGDRTMVPDRGANAALSPADIVLPTTAGPSHLHLSGYVLLDNGSRPAGLAALAAAADRGWTTSVDPQAASHLAARDPGEFLSWVDGVDLLLPNEAELAALGGVDAALHHVGTVAVTRAGTGAAWIDRRRTLELPAPAVRQVDATGAGDAFDAGLLAAWVDGADADDALRAGIAAGSAAVTVIGGQPPTWRSGDPRR